MSTTRTPDPVIPARPHMLESHGLLGAVLALAHQIPDWTDTTFTSAEINWSGRLHLAVSGRTQGEELAARLNLTQTDHETYPTTFPLSHDVPGLTHRMTWHGTYAGHRVEILTYWDAPRETTTTTVGASALDTTTAAPIPSTHSPRPAPRPTGRTCEQQGGERSVRFEARFDSTCPACEEPIEAGADVAWSDGEVVHEECAMDAGVEVFER